MAEDWYRNRTWDADIARAFDEKLGRARRKEQYLRIQASMLAESHPAVALKLLERYFQLPDDFDHAQAHCDRAAAFEALGRFEDAAAAYEAALAREVEFPKLRTQAYLHLPMLVARQRMETRYERAILALDQNANRILFPVERFRWHGARALILAAQGDQPAAATHARSALEAAASQDSGFRHHRAVGLVTPAYDSLIQQLAGLA